MQSKRNHLLQSGIWSVLGTFLARGTYFLTIPLFSRILTVEEYGAYGIFVTYSNILTVILALNLSAAVSPGVIKFQERKDSFLASGMSLSLILFAGFFLIMQLFHGFIEGILQISYFQLNMLLLYSFSQHVLTYCASMLVMEFAYLKNTIVSVGAMLAEILLSTLLILVFMKEDRLQARILGAAIPNSLVCVLLICLVLRRSRDWFDTGFWKFAVVFSTPLIFHSLSHLVLGQSDRIMIDRMIGQTEAGMYTLVHNIAVMLNALQTALNNVWIPWSFRRLKENAFEEIRSAAKVYILLFSIITIGVLAISPEIVKILAPPEYWSAIGAAIPIILATYMGFLYTLFVNVEVFYEKSRSIALGTCIAAAINIVLNYLLLPRFGYYAAAYTTLISYSFLLLMHCLICTFLMKKRVFDGKNMLRNMGIVLVIAMADSLLIHNMLIRYALCAAVLFALYLMNRQMLKQFLKNWL